MSDQSFNNQNQLQQNQPQVVQNQPQVVVVQNESQAVPVILAFFFGGIGQLVQGRILAGLLWLFSEWVLGAILIVMTLGFGAVLLPITHLLCIIDAAIYKPSSGKKIGALVWVGMCINGIGVFIILGIGAAATSGM